MTDDLAGDDLFHHHDSDFLSRFEGDVPVGTVTPSALRRRVRRAGPALVTFLAVLVVWEGSLAVFDVQAFILPAPSAILGSFIDEFTTIMSASFTTAKEALGGFAIGVSLALAAALATARWTQLRDGLLPFAIAANSIPIIALAPIANAWFGLTSPLSKMTVVAVIVFFPVMINTVRGLTDVDESELELMRSYASTPRGVVRRLRIPNSLPFLFSALKVASALAIIGAIVAEYFGGRQDALGPYVTSKAQLFQFDDAWAAILAASIMGVLFYGAVLAVERVAMPWHVSLRAADDR